MRGFAAALFQMAGIFTLILVPAKTFARWADADDAVYSIELRNIFITVKKDGSYRTIIEERAKILKDAARQSKGTVRFTYNSRASSIHILGAETINNGLSIPVDTKTIEDKPLASNISAFDQQDQVLIAFPNIEVGSETYLKYEIDTQEIPTQAFYGSTFYFGSSEFEKAATLDIQSELPLVLDAHDPGNFLDIKRTLENGTTHIQAKLKRPIQMTLEDETQPFFNPGVLPRLSVASASNWNAIAEPSAIKYEQILASPLPREFDEIFESAQKQDSEINKINTVTSELANRMRYMGDWRSVNGGYVPRSLQTIATSKFGDCKDFSISTVAILRKLGFESFVAWTTRQESPVRTYYGLPTNHFNHAIVWASHAGKIYWIDPTNLTSFAQGIFEDIADRPALIIRDRGGLERIPARNPSDDRSTLVEEADFSFPDKIVTSAILRYEGAAAIAVTGTGLDLSPEIIRHTVIGAISNESRLLTSDVTLPDLKSRIVKDVEFKYSFSERAPEMKTSAGDAYKVPGSGRLTQTLIETENRVSDLYLGQPQISQQTFIIRNAETIGSEGLACTLTSPWVDAKRQSKRTKKGLEITDLVEIKKPIVSNAELKSPQFKKLQHTVMNCFRDVAIVYRPVNRSLSSQDPGSKLATEPKKAP